MITKIAIGIALFLWAYVNTYDSNSDKYEEIAKQRLEELNDSSES